MMWQTYGNIWASKTQYKKAVECFEKALELGGIDVLFNNAGYGLAGPLAAKLPLSALAGVLIVVAYQLIRVDDIVRTVRATRSDAAVMVVTFLVTVFVNIEFSIYVGVLLSIGLHLAKTSHPRIYSVVPDQTTGKMVGFVQGETCCQIDIVQI